MDSAAEGIESASLAGDIKKGLPANEMSKVDFSGYDIEAMKTKFGDIGSVKADALGAWIVDEYQKATKNDPDSDFATFQASGAYANLCKWTAHKEAKKKQPVTMKWFTETRPLGRGAFGAVYLTFSKDTGYAFAVKKMVKKIAKKNNMLKDVLIEHEVLGKMNSRFAVSLHYAYQDATTIFLGLFLCAGGDLAFQIQQRYSDAAKKEDRVFKPFEEGVLPFWGASMVLGLDAVHQCGYVYRDLKPQNVLLDQNGQVRISDMGLVADVSKKAIKQCSGTRGYWAPEQITKTEYKEKPDYWSLGVTLYVLFSDKMPFKGKTDEEKDAASVSGVIEFSHGEPDDLQKVVSDLCTIDPEKRLTGKSAIMAHPYFKSIDFAALEAGKLEAKIVPNPDQLNVPSKSEIAAFEPPKDVEWGDDDQAKFATWDYFGAEAYNEEIKFRLLKVGGLGQSAGGGGGGGCCEIS